MGSTSYQIKFDSWIKPYVGIIRTYIVLLFISCARLFFSYIVFYILLSRAHDFFISQIVFSFLLSRAHDFFLF